MGKFVNRARLLCLWPQNQNFNNPNSGLNLERSEKKTVSIIAVPGF